MNWSGNKNALLKVRELGKKVRGRRMEIMDTNSPFYISKETAKKLRGRFPK